MSHNNLLRAALFSAAFVTASTALGQGKDELWEVTSKMEMADMPMAMPAQTTQVCKQTGKGDADLVPKQDNCTVMDSKRSGNKFTFKMICQDGNDKYTGTGEITSTASTYNGTMKMKGTMEGEPVDMTQTFSGKKIGNCNYADEQKKAKAQVAQVEAKIAKSQEDACNEQIEKLGAGPMLFTDGQLCAKSKPKFCGKAKQVAGEMGEPAGYEAARKKYTELDNALKFCALDPDAILHTVCRRSIDKREWAFTAGHCPVEAKELSAKFCEGREYTVAMSSEYAPICGRYAKFAGRDYTAQPRATGAASGGTGQSATRVENPQADSATKEAKPSASDQIKDGASKLKKFLKF